MEASVVEAPVEAQAENTEQIFKWNTWVHVGPGAEQCDGIVRDDVGRVLKVTCPQESLDTPLEERHFHAWCRLPNQFAYRDISDKARAARARKQRQLRDPDSDERLVLEDELATMRENVEGMIDEIVYSKFTDQDEAERTVREDEQFEHIDQDREEHARQTVRPADERDDDAYDSLERHIQAFGDAVRAELGKIRKRREESLRGLEVDEIVEQVRKLRIDRVGVAEYLHVSNYWVWYVGTMVPVSGTTERKFADINKLISAPGEVIAALQLTFVALESHLSPGGAAKNS